MPRAQLKDPPLLDSPLSQVTLRQFLQAAAAAGLLQQDPDWVNTKEMAKACGGLSVKAFRHLYSGREDIQKLARCIGDRRYLWPRRQVRALLGLEDGT